MPTFTCRREDDLEDTVYRGDPLQPTANDATASPNIQSRADAAELVSPTSTSELGMTCLLFPNESSMYPSHYHSTWQYQQIMHSLQPLLMMGYNMYPMLTLLTPANHQYLLNCMVMDTPRIKHILDSNNM